MTLYSGCLRSTRDRSTTRSLQTLFSTKYSIYTDQKKKKKIGNNKKNHQHELVDTRSMDAHKQTADTQVMEARSVDAGHAHITMDPKSMGARTTMGTQTD